MARRIFSASLILGCLILGALLLSNRNAYAQTSTATVTRTNTSPCSPVIVVTSTPSPTLSPTPRVATSTTTPTCHAIYITATPGAGMPDLSVVSITEFTFVAPTATAPGCWQLGGLSRTGLRVTVQNTGTGDAGSFAVDLNGSVTTVSGLAAGQTTTVDYFFQTVPRTRTAIVDSTGLVAESNETNNALTVTLSAATPTSTGTGALICNMKTNTPTPTFTPTPTRTGTLTTPGIGPDLVISGIVYVGSTPTCANQLKERVDISNIGTADAGMFVVTINGTQYQINSLAAGQSTSIVISASMSVTATADSTNLIAESNETNNSASANFPLPSQAPTCTPTGGPSLTPTRTPTFTPSPTSVGNTCSPVSATITAPFTKDGVGTFCWQSSNLGSYINNWSMTSVTINGINITNVYTAASSYPAKIGGFWYVTYNGPFSWSHFEAK